MTPTTNALLRLAAASVVATALGLAGCKHSDERQACVVTDREAHALYDQLLPALRGKDCTFEALDADKQRLTLSLGGAPEPLVVAHHGCVPHASAAGDHYDLLAPAATTSHCAGAVRAVRTVLESASPPPPPAPAH